MLYKIVTCFVIINFLSLSYSISISAVTKPLPHCKSLLQTTGLSEKAETISAQQVSTDSGIRKKDDSESPDMKPENAPANKNPLPSEKKVETFALVKVKTEQNDKASPGPDPETSVPVKVNRTKKKGIRQSKFDPIIHKASKQHGVSFALVKAMIEVESNFNPRAVSRAGARGLMQIMPVNYKNLKITDPFNPSENIMGGTKLMKYLIKRYKGNLDLALAAYNAGPTKVDRYKRVPPIKETRNYVKKVKRNYRKYIEGNA